MKAIFWGAIILIALPVVRYLILSARASKAKSESVNQYATDDDSGEDEQTRANDSRVDN